ncbi:MAG: hypothetical protein QW292_13725 [Candidatus Parvarchaeota archaeon]
MKSNNQGTLSKGLYKFLIAIVIIVIISSAVTYIVYENNYSSHPERAAVIPLSEMESITKDNLTLWITSQSNATYILAFYNLTKNNIVQGYIEVMSIFAPSSVGKLYANTTSLMYNESLVAVHEIEKTSNSTPSISMNIFRGFRYFIAIFSNDILMSAGYQGRYFFYIYANIKISDPQQLVQSEINIMSS